MNVPHNSIIIKQKLKYSLVDDGDDLLQVVSQLYSGGFTKEIKQINILQFYGLNTA